MDAPRRERRHHHHRKAAAQVQAAPPAIAAVGVGGNGAAAARAAYGDVFGGPPRFSAPFGGAPADYAEVFGGVAATCSIPFLDLPPVPAVGADYGFFGRAGAGDYGEIFGRFDFGDFALPYEELFGEMEAEAVGEIGAEEIASSTGSSSRFVPFLPSLASLLISSALVSMECKTFCDSQPHGHVGSKMVQIGKIIDDKRV
uniref:Uncharacterized protein n=1 Tax=Oryza meridionalis TaxID=40149 RepID=A0A0E0DUV0_9ORYZ